MNLKAKKIAQQLHAGGYFSYSQARRIAHIISSEVCELNLKINDLNENLKKKQDQISVELPKPGQWIKGGKGIDVKWMYIDEEKNRKMKETEALKESIHTWIKREENDKELKSIARKLVRDMIELLPDDENISEFIKPLLKWRREDEEETNKDTNTCNNPNHVDCNCTGGD